MGDNKAFFLAWCKNNQISWLQKPQFGHLAVPEFVFSPPILLFTLAASSCPSSSSSSASASWFAIFIAVSRTPMKFCWPPSVPWSGGQPGANNKTHTPMKKPYTSTVSKIPRHTWTQNLPGGTGRSDKLTGRPALWALMASWYCC